MNITVAKYYMWDNEKQLSKERINLYCGLGSDYIAHLLSILRCSLCHIPVPDWYSCRETSLAHEICFGLDYNRMMITNPLNTGEFNAIKCGMYLMRLKMDNGEHNAVCLSLSLSLSLTHTHTHTHTSFLFWQ